MTHWFRVTTAVLHGHCASNRQENGGMILIAPYCILDWIAFSLPRQ